MSFIKNIISGVRLSSIKYQLLDNISSIDEISIDHSEVTFLSSYGWEEFYGSPSSILFKETKKDSDAGKYYLQSVGCQYPDEDDDNLDLLNSIENKRIVLRLEYTSGKVKLMGTFESWVIMSEVYESNQNDTGRTFQSTCEALKRAPWLDES